MMQIEEYFSEYDTFDAEFFPGATIGYVIEKFGEEMHEAQIEVDAIWAGMGDQQSFIGETIDVLNMAIKTLRMYGVVDPLQAGADKLRTTAAKYRRKRGDQ